MFYNFIICEDNRIFNEAYQKVIKKVAKELKIEVKIFSFFKYCEEFKKIIYSDLENKVYILDLLTPGKSGDEIASMIRKSDLVSFIIFITSYHDDYEDSILNGEYSYLKYIDKFKNYETVLYDVLKRNIKIKQNIEVLKIEVKNQFYNIIPNDLTEIYTDGRKIVLNNIKDESIVIPTTLKNIKNILPDYFVLSKSCCLVNLKRIKAVDKNKRTITFDNNHITNLVSKKNLKYIIDELNK